MDNNPTWLKRTNKNSELCHLRHTAKYTAFAHAETTKRYAVYADVTNALWLSTIAVPLSSLIVVAKHSQPSVLFAVAGVNAVFAIGFGLATQAQRKRDVHNYAFTKWQSLFVDASTLAARPSTTPITPDEFDTQLVSLKARKSELDNTQPRTINRDYKTACADLNANFEQQDWDRWERMYGE